MIITNILYDIIVDGICGLIIISYSLIGGFLFRWLEAGANNKIRSHIASTRNCHMKKLWEVVRISHLHADFGVWENKTLDLVRQFEGEVFAAVADGGWDGHESGAPDQDWTLASSILYSVCLITTIGYGNVAPKTNAGKLASVVYALIGIPLFLIFLAKIGSMLALAFRIFFSNSIEKGFKRKREEKIRVPVIVSLSLIFTYLVLGGWFFSSIEKDWSFLTAVYFCFITLSTIGLGDYVAGSTAGQSDARILAATTIYVVFGMSLLAVIFDLVKEEVLAQLVFLASYFRCGSSYRKEPPPIKQPPSKPPSPSPSQQSPSKLSPSQRPSSLQQPSQPPPQKPPSPSPSPSQQSSSQESP